MIDCFVLLGTKVVLEKATTYIPSTNSDQHNVLSSNASSHMSQVVIEDGDAKG